MPLKSSFVIKGACVMSFVGKFLLTCSIITRRPWSNSHMRLTIRPRASPKITPPSRMRGAGSFGDFGVVASSKILNCAKFIVCCRLVCINLPTM